MSIVAVGAEKNTAVQGLRAFAVVSVVLFHLQVPHFGGGYLGVDVFFVLSGYIIFKLYYKKITSLTSCVEFLKRRLFRIFPALFVVCTVSLLVAAVILPPPLLEQSAKHYLSAILFVSNFVFRAETGYFDIGSDFKPFLHTWSLSVEWQTYMFSALLVAWMSRADRKVFMALLLVGALGSLTIMLTMTERKNMTFFMFPFRLWEFGLGVLAAHFSDRATIRAAHLASKFGSFIAELILIFLLVTVIMWPFYSTEHNMVWACVLTAAYLILTGSRDNVLNLGPLQFLGNISYSIYLLHWPLIVFYKYYIFREPTVAEKALLFCGSIALANVSYRYIEEFFKRFGTVSLRTFLQWKGAGAVTIAVFSGPICGIILYGLNGLPQRYDESQREQFAYFKRLDEDYKRMYQDEVFPGSHYLGEHPALRKNRVVCSYDNISRLRDAEVDARRVATLVECISAQRSYNENNYPSYLVIGDSNGLDAYRALNDAFPSRHFVMLMQSGCAPQDYKDCFPGLEEVVQRSMQGQRFDGVILAARYSQQDVSQLEDTVKRLAALGEKMLIVGPSMVLRRNIDETYLAKKFDMNQSIVSLDFDPNIFVYDSIGNGRWLHSIASSLHLVYFDRLTAFCPEEHCYLRKGEAPLLTDSQHLSVSGIRYLAEAFRADVQVVEFFDTASRSLIQENAHSLIQAK